MEAPHDPLYAGFHPQGHPLGVLGLIEPLDPLSLDAKKVRAFFETQKVWSAYNSVGMCDFVGAPLNGLELQPMIEDRKSTRLNSSHTVISYAVFCLKKKISEWH